MKAPKKNNLAEYDDFYKKLRRTVKRQLNAWRKKKKGKKKTSLDVLIEMLFLLPDLFHLSVRLLLDKKVPTENKGALVAGIAYLVSPIDLIPDAIPVYGYVDDLIVMALALNKFLDTKDKKVADAVKRHWAGDEDVFKVVKHIIAVADAAVEFLPKKLLRILKGMFKGK